jgi:adenylyltransferase/sulfurtransferase
MNDAQLLQFSRHIMLPDFDVAGQERLLQSKVLLIGAGGLGSPIALYLGAAGVGELTIVDDDQVDSSNLQRQIAHSDADIGRNKATSAAESVQALNPSTVCHTINRRLDAEALGGQIAAVDLVIDATDNAETRFLLNRICWQRRTPLVSGAAVRWEGHISVFDANRHDSPCYQCLYPDTQLDDQLNCAENGVISPLVGVIGSMQALEAIKCLTEIGESLVGTVLFFDAKFAEWRRIGLSKNPNCPVCANPPVAT